MLCPGAVVGYAPSLRREAASVVGDTRSSRDAWQLRREARGVGEVVQNLISLSVALRRHRGVARVAGCSKRWQACATAYRQTRSPCAVVRSRQWVLDGVLSQIFV
jgi:hypothetical protein